MKNQELGQMNSIPVSGGSLATWSEGKGRLVSFLHGGSGDTHHQEELWEGTGNRESFRKSFFSKDSIILWTIKTHRSVRVKYESYMQDPKYSHIKFVRLKNHREADEFLIKVGLS